MHTYLESEAEALHARLMRLPLFTALRSGTLPVTSITSLLRGFAILHALVEREVATSRNDRLRQLGGSTPARLPMLLRDLEALNTRSTGASMPSIARAMDQALKVAADMLTDSSNPAALIGPLYLIERWTLGDGSLASDVGQCLGQSAPQLSYFAPRDASLLESAWTRCLEAMPLDAREMSSVRRSVEQCARGIETMCMALYPFTETTLSHHVTAINPEAGDHAIPQDPRDIALALHVGRQAWLRHPYLEQRFGERGLRFTLSDSCWLVSLARLPVETTTRSLGWLRTVLASRGIPTVILETHLRAINVAFEAECTDHASLSARYEPFLTGLERERAASRFDFTIAPLVARHEPRLAACVGHTVTGAAALIASAWHDELHGSTGALAAIRDWMIDPARFPAAWIDGVHDFVNALPHQDARPC